MSNEKKKRQLSAAALRYREKEDDAPRLIVKGKRKIAEKILLIAREHNIPIREDPDLLELLFKLDAGEEIPHELYRVVAEVFAYIYMIRSRYINTMKNQGHG